MSRLGKGFFLLGLSCSLPAYGAADSLTFDEWREEFRREAVDSGVSAQTLDIAFAEQKLIPSVITRDRKQPELRKDFQSYIDNAINVLRIRKAKKMLAQNESLLNDIYKKYGVPPAYLVAFWAMETDFGNRKGDYPIISALSTLAYDTRRPDFFRSELMHAVRMVQAGILPDKMKGSWAGAFGNFQFMPSTYHAFAVDYDGDGTADLWNSLPDALASAANYLSAEGWNKAIGWGKEVFLPKRFDWNLIERQKTLREWQAAGIEFSADAAPLSTTAKLFLPAGIQGPAFLVYSNFDVILQWNNSVLYAVAIGHLADRIQGLPPFKKKYATGKTLTLEDSIEVQELLAEMKLYDGKADGILGRKSREAVRKFQNLYDFPADGYAGPSLLHFMRLVLSGGAERKDLTFDEVRELQTILSKGSYYKGPIDGKMGKSTQTAIDLYKKVYGLQEKEVNRKLLTKMRLQAARGMENGEQDPAVTEFWRKEEELRKKELKKQSKIKKLKRKLKAKNRKKKSVAGKTGKKVQNRLDSLSVSRYSA